MPLEHKQTHKCLSTLLVYLSIIFGILITSYGFYELISLQDSKTHWRIGYIYLAIFIIGSALVFILQSISILKSSIIGLLLAIIIYILSGTPGTPLILAILILSAYSFGFLIVGRYEDRPTIVILVGLVPLGTLIGLASHISGHIGLYLSILTIPIFICKKKLISRLREITIKCEEVDKPTLNSLLNCSIVGVIFIHLLVSLMPEVGHDALAMHLFVPSYVSTHQTWSFNVESYVWAVMPMLVDWLYTVVYAFTGEPGTRALNLVGILFISYCVKELVLWASGNRTTSAWAVLIFLSTPLTFAEVSTLHVETIWSALTISSFLLILEATTSTKEAKAKCAVSALLLAGAISAKAVSLTILPIFSIIGIVAYKRSRLSLNLSFLVFLGVAMIFASIPYIQSMILTGNPVFPFFNNLFKSPYFDLINFAPPSIFEKGFDIGSIYRMTFNSGRFLEASSGAPGFQWTLLFLFSPIPLIFAKKFRALSIIAIILCTIYLVFSQTAYLRYIYPTIALSSVSIAITYQCVSKIGNFASFLALTLMIITVLLNLAHFDSGTWYGDIELSTLFNKNSKAEYLEKHLPIRSAINAVNALNTEERPVAFFSLPLAAGLDSEALYANWYNSRFLNEIWKTHSSKQFTAVLKKYNIKFLITDDNWEHPHLVKLAKLSTIELGRFGPISLRKLENKNVFNQELMEPYYPNNTASWSFSGQKPQSLQEGILVNIRSPAYTTIPVNENETYKLTATVLSVLDNTQARLQVNWLDSDGKFLSTNIELVECKQEPLDYSMDIVAPHTAAYATIYAVGHTEKDVTYLSLSFKR